VNGDRFARAAALLGAVGLLSPVFALTTSSNNNFVTVQNGGLVVLVVLGALAVLGGRTGRMPLVLAAGLGFAAAALLQLLQLGRSTNWFDGSGSTFSLLLALAVGLVTVGVVGRRPEGGTTPPDS